MEPKDWISISVSALALLVSLGAGLRQLLLTRQANALPVLVDLFREFRGDRQREARIVVFSEVQSLDLTRGLDGLPDKQRDRLRDIMWYFDNLGALVTHGIVDIQPIAGFMGGSILTAWERLAPLIYAERTLRGHPSDAGQYQQYFENLVHLVERAGPRESRVKARNWILDQ